MCRFDHHSRPVYLFCKVVGGYQYRQWWSGGDVISRGRRERRQSTIWRQTNGVEEEEEAEEELEEYEDM